MAAAHADTDRRVVTLVGDGSSQVRGVRERRRARGGLVARFVRLFPFLQPRTPPPPPH